MLLILSPCVKLPVITTVRDEVTFKLSSVTCQSVSSPPPPPEEYDPVYSNWPVVGLYTTTLIPLLLVSSGMAAYKAPLALISLLAVTEAFNVIAFVLNKAKSLLAPSLMPFPIIIKEVVLLWVLYLP